MRVATVGNPNPYEFFGTFAGVPFWGGGLTLLAAAPGIGKTSWLLRQQFEASAAGIPAVLGCYEHTEAELKYRFIQQAKAMVGGAHGAVSDAAVNAKLAACSQAVLLALDDSRDTIRGLEERLIGEFGFPEYGYALVAVDYLNRIPVVGLTGMLPADQRSGQAATGLRELAKKHNWAIIAAAALKKESFRNTTWDLSDLDGDERVPYVADRVLLVSREGEVSKCGCLDLAVHTLKNRAGRIQTWKLQFWGERFYPVLEHEFDNHFHAPANQVIKEVA